MDGEEHMGAAQSSDLGGFLRSRFGDCARVTRGGEDIWLYKKRYAPFRDMGESFFIVDAYCVAANELFHQTESVLEELNGLGIKAERYRGADYKRLIVNSGLAYGRRRNSLAYDDEGSRFVIGAISVTAREAIDDAEAEREASECQKQRLETSERLTTERETSEHAAQRLEPSELLATERGTSEDNPDRSVPEIQQALCGNCMICVGACPSKALSEKGLDPSKCLRSCMNSGGFPDEATAVISGRRLLGCDLCQRACPLNRQEEADVPGDLMEALRADSFIGNFRRNRRLLSRYVGANYARAGIMVKLSKQLIRAGCFSGIREQAEEND